MMARTKRTFSKEFRAGAVKLVIDGGKTSSYVAKEHDLSPSLVAGWVRQARIDAGDNPRQAPSSAERDELIRLRKLTREQELELAFLKKTAAYFASQKR